MRQVPAGNGDKVSGKADGKDKITAWVVLKEKANLAGFQGMRDWKARGKAVHEGLQKHADASQSNLRAWLKKNNVDHKPFWIVNTIRVTVSQATLAEIAKRPDVAEILEDKTFPVPPLMPAASVPAVEGTEWGIGSIRAPDAWQAFGAYGDGIVVASVDTGVQYDHPALVNQYRGRQADGSFNHNYNWYDPSLTCGNPSLAPCDNNNHGTHTMGTMVGDDGSPGTNRIGVAPHAKWISAKGCEQSSCSTSSLLAAGQWILAPTDLNGQNPRSDLRPNIVNNSWGGGGGAPGIGRLCRAGWRPVSSRRSPTETRGRAAAHQAHRATTPRASRPAPTTSTTPLPASRAEARRRSAESSSRTSQRLG